MADFEEFKRQVIDEVSALLKKIKGVREVCELTNEEKKEALRIEVESEKKAVSGFMRCYNAGMRSVVEKEVVLAILHDENYRYPPETVQLICGGEVVGEEVREKERAEELKKRRDVLWLGDTFVIYKDRLPRGYRKKMMSGSIYIFIPPMSVKELEKVDRIYGVVEAMPSTPTDLYLKDRLKLRGIDVSHPKLGVALVGFNILY